MALIVKLAELRFDNFLKEFNIDTDDFNYNNRKIKWEELKQKFIKYGYVTKHCDFIDCYFVIKSIVWKNIVAYSLVDKKLYVIMYHNNYKYISYINYISYPQLFYDELLCKKWYKTLKLKDNCIALQRKIINYITLLDILVSKYMISDLAYPFKNYLFYVMLLV